MSTLGAASTPSYSNLAGIACVVTGVLCLGIQDMIIKLISSDYPLHEIGFVRSLFAIVITLVLIQMEGGFRQILQTRHPWSHVLRGLLMVSANMAYFLGLVSLQLAEAAAIFFSAPLIITLMAIPVLGERVGVRRWLAVMMGLLGVLIMLRPGEGVFRLVGLLPLLGAVCYASLQMLTRRYGTFDKASVMALYAQMVFIGFSAWFGVFFGSGWMADPANPTLDFLFRAWRMPDLYGLSLMAACGAMVGVGGYLLTQGYRLAEAKTAAQFEYTGLPFAVLLGFLVWQDLPDIYSVCGMALVAGSGLYVVYREATAGKSLASSAPLSRQR